MSRDNKVSARVVLDASQTVCTNQPNHAADEMVRYLREEFGVQAVITDLRVEFHDEEGRLRRMVPDAIGRHNLAIGQPVAVSLVLEGLDGECGVYPIIGGGWSVRWLGRVLDREFRSELMANGHLRYLCLTNGGHTWIPDPVNDTQDKCARCGHGRTY